MKPGLEEPAQEEIGQRLMTGMETVLEGYRDILPEDEVSLLAWMWIGTIVYDLIYFQFRISRAKMDGRYPRTFIGASIAGIMLSYTLILFGGVIDEEYLSDVMALQSGRMILLLYSMVVVIIAFMGLFAGYSRVFKISNRNEDNESEKRTDRQQNRTTGWLIVAAVLSIIASVVSIVATTTIE